MLRSSVDQVSSVDRYDMSAPQDAQQHTHARVSETESGCIVRSADCMNKHHELGRRGVVLRCAASQGPPSRMSSGRAMTQDEQFVKGCRTRVAMLVLNAEVSRCAGIARCPEVPPASPPSPV